MFLFEGKKFIENFDFKFLGDLKPVGVKAQKKVPIPQGLNLDDPINELSDDEPEIEDISEDDVDGAFEEYKKTHQSSEKFNWGADCENFMNFRWRRIG